MKYDEWSVDEVRRLVDMWANKGLSHSQIAEKLGRTKNSVLGKLHRLGHTSETKHTERRVSAEEQYVALWLEKHGYEKTAQRVMAMEHRGK